MQRTLVVLMTGVMLSSAALHAQAPPTPASVVEAFHAAMKAGDGNAVLALLTPEVIVFESGGAEMSRAEFAEHHLQADMDFAASTTRQVTSQQSDSSGDVAWVMTRINTTGSFRDRDVRRSGVETMVLRRTGQGWRIVHIHWSSRSMR